MKRHLTKDSQEHPTDFRKAREQVGLSRERLAVLAGVSAATVYRIEMGRVAPHPLTRAAIEGALANEEDPERATD